MSVKAGNQTPVDASEGTEHHRETLKLTQSIINAVFEAESVLADFEVALEKGYVPYAKEIIYSAAHEIRVMQKLAITWNGRTDGVAPDWSRYTALEVAAVQEYSEEGGCKHADNVEDATYIALYGHLTAGGYERLHDFPEGFFDVTAITHQCQQLADGLGFKLINHIS